MTFLCLLLLSLSLNFEAPNVLLVPISGALITVHDLEADGVDPHILSSSEVLWLEVPVVLFSVLVLALLQELARDNSRVALLGLVDHQGVIVEVEGNHKLPANVLWSLSVHDSGEPELDLVINPLEVVLLLSLRLQSEAVPESVLFVAEVVVRGDLELLLVLLFLLDITLKREVDSVSGLIVVLSEPVTGVHLELPSEDLKKAPGCDIRVLQELSSSVGVSGEVQLELDWEPLPL